MTRKLNPGAVAGIIIGVIIIIFAIVMIGNAGNVTMGRVSSSELSKSSQFQMKYSFGADFYTEMFGVTYNALQQLQDMSANDAANTTASTNTIVSGIQKGTNHLGSLIAYVILAIGLATAGLSCTKLFVWLPADSSPAAMPEPVYHCSSPAEPAGDSAEPAEEEIPEEPAEEVIPEEPAEELSEAEPEQHSH